MMASLMWLGMWNCQQWPEHSNWSHIPSRVLEKNPDFCHLHLIIFIPYIDNSDGDLFISCPPKRPCLALLDVNMLVSSSVRTSMVSSNNCTMSVAEHSSNIPIGGLSGDSREHPECIEKVLVPNFAERLGNYFISGSPLCPEELLTYSLMKL